MSTDWESTFQSWARPPSDTEQTRCENAERAIQKAITASDQFRNRSIRVFAQGSYMNRTNVRLNSDVDICVLYKGGYFHDVAPGLTQVGADDDVPGTYGYPQFKDDLGSALTDHFGADGVTRGEKAFDVHENTYRIDADVIPCFAYRWYIDRHSYAEGVAFIPDGGHLIFNFPQQHYDNGVAKNERTGRRFKPAVRILKRLRDCMSEDGNSGASSMASFLIESLAWNVPDEGFGHSTFTADVRWVLAHLFNETRADSTCNEWTEVNGIKYLFRPSQPWRRDAANKFLNDAWSYVSFE